MHTQNTDFSSNWQAVCCTSSLKTPVKSIPTHCHPTSLSHTYVQAAIERALNVAAQTQTQDAGIQWAKRTLSNYPWGYQDIYVCLYVWESVWLWPCACLWMTFCSAWRSLEKHWTATDPVESGRGKQEVKEGMSLSSLKNENSFVWLSWTYWETVLAQDLRLVYVAICYLFPILVVAIIRADIAMTG